MRKPTYNQGAANERADFEGNVLPARLPTEALLDHLTGPGTRIVAMNLIAALGGSSS